MEYHLARLQYFYNKLDFLKKGMYPTFGGNIEFELYTFFEICYHLKNWIKVSKEIRFDKEVEKYVKDTACLQICKAIAEKLKHAGKDRNSDIDIFFEIKTETQVTPNPSDTKCTILSAEVNTEQGKMSCFTLAIECMEAWNNYFKINKTNLTLTI